MGTAPWWKRTTVYHVYPRSFADANGDGIGDLRGIEARLDYLHDLGVETLWLSPFFASPQRDFGYDISDHFAIAPEYGSHEDCARLFEAVHARGMKVVLDMVLNHTSDQHPWFVESRSSRTSPKRDYYLWRDGRKPKGALAPNNWRSALGDSGWRYDAHTEQWYFTSFLPFQPDLNYRNPEVRAAMLDVVRHWLRLGADGLRLDLFHTLFKDASFADNPFSLRPIPSESAVEGFFQAPRHTQHHPDTLAFARELRAVVDEFRDPSRFLVGEVFGPTENVRAYCGDEHDGLHLVFLFKALTTRFSAQHFRALIREFEAHFPEPFHPTWVFGNHDRPRMLDRLGDHVGKAKLLATLQLTARGVPFIYYGDELGLTHHELPVEGALDPIAERYRFVPRFLRPMLRKHGILLNRDSCRSPMPWTDAAHAGFSPPEAERTWLPVHPHAPRLHAAAQARDHESLLACYRRLLRWRRESAALSMGRLELMDIPRERAEHVLSYVRVHGTGDAREVAHVTLNFSARAQPLALPPNVSLVRSNLSDTALPSHQRVLTLAPFEGVIAFERGLRDVG